MNPSSVGPAYFTFDVPEGVTMLTPMCFGEYTMYDTYRNLIGMGNHNSIMSTDYGKERQLY